MIFGNTIPEREKEVTKEMTEERKESLATFIDSVVYTGFWAWGGPRSNGSVWGGVLFSLEKAKISRFFTLENFQKMFKNQ